MPRPKRDDLAAPQADETYVEADDGLEPFERPVPVVNPDYPVEPGMVIARVLPNGANKIATGHYDRAANKFSYYGKGDHLCIPLDVAKVQEDAGLLEIVNGG